MLQSPLRHRSLGLKFLLVGAIVLLLGIPISLISYLSWERQNRAEIAVNEVSQIYGGEQVLRGPYLVLPYTVQLSAWTMEDGRRVNREEIRQDHLIISAADLTYDIEQTVEMRHRSIYEIPVYNAGVSIQGNFEIPETGEYLPENSNVDWDSAQLVFAVSDLRAINNTFGVRIDETGEVLNFEPGTAFDAPGWRGVHANLDNISPGAQLSVTSVLSLTGASAFRLTASGRETHASLSSDWPHPGFHGGFLPGDRDISETGYQAEWDVPYLARSVPAIWQASQNQFQTLDQQAFGVRLITPADGYQQVGRSLKYALFFIGFVMLMFFLIETNSKARIHPAQYILAGMAQVIFYLLLLAISEHAAVGLAFFLAAGATVTLTGFYAVMSFANRALGVSVFAAMGVVYAMQYALILMEDYALLIGSALAFGGLAATMLMTRQIDWYGKPEQVSPPQSDTTSV